jgi:hypothetical protein
MGRIALGIRACAAAEALVLWTGDQRRSETTRQQQKRRRPQAHHPSTVSRRLPGRSCLDHQRFGYMQPVGEQMSGVQSTGVPGAQPPAPLHVPGGVKMLRLQLPPLHCTPVGYVHAPVPSQAVAPHVPPVVHAAVQQLPVPLVPQTPDRHSEFAVQAPPFGTTQPRTGGDTSHTRPVIEQSTGVPGSQAPDPLHVPAGV